MRHHVRHVTPGLIYQMVGGDQSAVQTERRATGGPARIGLCVGGAPPRWGDLSPGFLGEQNVDVDCTYRRTQAFKLVAVGVGGRDAVVVRGHFARLLVGGALCRGL